MSASSEPPPDVTPAREIGAWLMDMDGVLVREEQAIPGAADFLARLRQLGVPFLVLTNNSMYTRRDLAARLRATSALATAQFLPDRALRHLQAACRISVRPGRRSRSARLG